jgi:hypothetical protein
LKIWTNRIRISHPRLIVSKVRDPKNLIIANGISGLLLNLTKQRNCPKTRN